MVLTGMGPAKRAVELRGGVCDEQATCMECALCGGFAVMFFIAFVVFEKQVLVA